jgi:hypothetical protein
MPLELDDHMLRDIGITRAEYQFLPGVVELTQRAGRRRRRAPADAKPRANGGLVLAGPSSHRWWFWCNVPLPPAFTFGAGTPEHLASPLITA